MRWEHCTFKHNDLSLCRREQRCNSFAWSQRDSMAILVARLRPAESRRGQSQWRDGNLGHRSGGENWMLIGKMLQLLLATSWVRISPLAIPVLTCRRSSQSSTPPSPPLMSIQPSGVAQVWHWSHICQRLKNLPNTWRQITSTSAASAWPPLRQSAKPSSKPNKKVTVGAGWMMN